jgi:hypothetical protein
MPCARRYNVHDTAASALVRVRRAKVKAEGREIVGMLETP